MSTSATIPVFDPQGVLRDIPQDQLAAAVKNGGMPAVKFTAPDKTIRFVPANRYQEAASAGGTVMPFEQQDVKHPGFWSTLYDDVKGMAGGAAATVGAGFDAARGNPLPMATQAAQTVQSIQDNMQHRRDEGRSLPYRTVAPVGDALGVNTRGMEDAADQGNTAGVLGHAAAVPAVMAATEGVARGAPVVADAAKAGAKVASPVVKAVATRWPEVAGATTGAAVGHATGIPGAGYVGASIGREMGAALRGKLVSVLEKTPKDFVSELDATGENADYAGAKPPKPQPWNAHDATKEFPPFAGGVDDAPSIPQRLATPAEPTPAPAATTVTPSVSVDPVLQRLRTIAAQIEKDEAAKPPAPMRRPAATKIARVPDPGEDLMGLLQESLKQALAQ